MKVICLFPGDLVSQGTPSHCMKSDRIACKKSRTERTRHFFLIFLSLPIFTHVSTIKRSYATFGHCAELNKYNQS